MLDPGRPIREADIKTRIRDVLTRPQFKICDDEVRRQFSFTITVEGRNKLGRLVVELAILVSLPRWAPMGGEDDHPEAESTYSPRL